MPQQKLLEAVFLVALLVATAKNKDKGMKTFITSRIFIALIAAASTYIATEFPTVHNSICGVTEWDF